MSRYCAHCKTPLTSHALVIDGADFHSKTCFCAFSGHRLEGDRKRKPKPCRACEPSGRLVPGQGPGRG